VATTVLLIYLLHRSHFPSPSVRSHAAETFRVGQVPLWAAAPSAVRKWVASQGLPGSWGIHPIPLPRSKIPAGPAGLTLSAYPVLSPQSRPRRHQRCLFRNSITRLRYPPSTLQV